MQLDAYLEVQAEALELCRQLVALDLRGYIAELGRMQDQPRYAVNRQAQDRLAAIKSVAQALMLAQEAYADLVDTMGETLRPMLAN